MSKSTAIPIGLNVKNSLTMHSLVYGFPIIILAFLALYRLTDFPTTWFDEGSHLHVPKTFVRLGTYADYSSEGFRYYGPTLGVGPTVMLPIIASFKLFGVGLWQARVVMVLYLFAAVVLFFRLAQTLGDATFAWLATALLVTSRSITLIEYGREVLGEVPGLFFLVWGLWVWFTAWERASWRRLFSVGVLLGLAVITKNQYLLVLAPTLLLAWGANLFYYRVAPQRVFLVPGILTAASYGFWQLYLLAFLGPSSFSENLAMFREITAGAAFVFNLNLMKRGMQELLSFTVYLGVLVPVWVYGFCLALPRCREGQQWGLLWLLMSVNLLWYVVASISWLRYAFPALAIASLFVARFFADVTDGFKLDMGALRTALTMGSAELSRHAVRWVMTGWLAMMIVVPLAQTVLDVVRPPFNAPLVMAEYLNARVSHETLIETWEPEMGFLTDHHYHYPPQLLLNKAIGYIWLNGAPPAQAYTEPQKTSPPYILEGEFARWVGMYSEVLASGRYQLLETIGTYKLYALKP